MVADADITAPPTQTSRSTAPPVAAYALRALRRPRPWALLYALTLIPAAVLAPALALMLLTQAAHAPLFREMLRARSLDMVPDLLTYMTRTPVPTPARIVTLVALVAVPLVWLVTRLVWLWLEGGALATYAAEAPPSWRAFTRAGTRWLGSLLLLNLVGIVAVVLVGGVTLALVALVDAVFAPLGWVPGAVGLLLVIVIVTEVEVARAAAVVHEDRHVLRALRRALRLTGQRPLPLALLVVGALALQGGLLLVQRGILRLVPIPWWLTNLVALQAIAVARLGVRLARQAGEVGLLKLACE
jgi:hypothetical protein